MAVDLPGKPILISGASSGIGRATAIECAKAGMHVVVMARREDRLRALVDEINAPGFLSSAAAGRAGQDGSATHGAAPGSITAAFAPPRPRAVMVVGDVSRQADCDAAVARCVEAYGSIYAVFANAGFGVEAPLHEMPEAQLREIVEVNLFGSTNLIRAALPHMLKAGAGHVLWCSSCLAKLALPRGGAYSATKAAQHHLSRAMNVELRRTRVRSSSVHPVGTKTEFFETTARRSDGRGALSPNAPEWSMQPPERVARAVVRCLRRPTPEVWTSLPARIGFPLLGLFPRTVDWALARVFDKEPGPRNVNTPEALP